MNPITLQSPPGLEILRLDAETATERITAAVREQVLGTLRRRGAVVGLSGGIDSSVVASLCVRALGPERVLGLFMPERDSSQETLDLSRQLADHLGIDAVLEDVTGVLEAAGCYHRRDAAIRSVFPDFGPGCKSKIVLNDLLGGSPYRVFSVVIRTPDGQIHRRRLPLEAYQTVVAATNYKQRTRKMIEYYHADRLHYAVAGTPNRLEYELGFFVKGGDGAADFKPIAHLYKTQVYQLAEHLDVPEAIRRRPPTTDTYSLPQSQEEFYFSLPYDQMDLCLFGKNHQILPGELSAATGLSTDEIERVWRDIDAKRQVAQYLHAAGLLVEEVLPSEAEV